MTHLVSPQEPPRSCEECKQRDGREVDRGKLLCAVCAILARAKRRGRG